jgi:two-component system, LuxR family, response regulator FixJ
LSNKPPIGAAWTRRDDKMASSNALIFVVDDDAAVRSSLKFSLEIEGFVVRTYASAEELLRESDLAACQCFIIDQNMPRMHGLQLFAALRRQGVDSPVIMTSSNATSALSRQASTAGIPVIEKPFLGNSLIETVHAAVESKPR